MGTICANELLALFHECSAGDSPDWGRGDCETSRARVHPKTDHRIIEWLRLGGTVKIT